MSNPFETIAIGPLQVVFFASKGDTDGHADVFELRVPPAAKVPGPHTHVGMDEVLIGLEGTLTYVVGDQIHDVGPGERALSPRGVVHYFVNRTAESPLARWSSVRPPRWARSTFATSPTSSPQERAGLPT